MLRAFLACPLLIALATTATAASFKYSSGSVSQLDYHTQHWESGGNLYPSTDLNLVSDVVIEFEINQRIRKNTTYTYDRSAQNWTIRITGGGIRSDYLLRADIYRWDRWADAEFSITTGEDRQVVDWRFLLENGSTDFFIWNSSPSREQSFGLYEYIDQECLESGNFEEDCYVSEGFGARGTGKWEAIAPVPLPASLPLLAAGIFCLRVWRRKRA